MNSINVITHSGKDLIKILDEEINDLRQYFSNLSPSLFTNPSSADGWTNADVLSHITMGALSYHMYLSRALEGILDPPEGLPSPQKGYLQTDVSTTILESTKQLEYGNVSTLIDMFAANCHKLHELLSNIGDDEWNKPVYHRLGHTTVRGLLLYRISEVCLHAWDIKASTESIPSLHPRTIHPLLERVPGWLDWVFKPGYTKDNSTTCYHYHVTDPVKTFWEITISEDSFIILDKPSANPTLTFESESETAILFLAGRLKADKLIEENLLSVNGSEEDLGIFLQSYTSI